MELGLTEDCTGQKTRRDPLRRFTPTPLKADLRVMGRNFRLETNNRAAFDHAAETFARYGKTTPAPPQFLWRIIADADQRGIKLGPELNAFSDKGLRFATLSQSSFIAVDLEVHEAVGFLPQEWAEDDLTFVSAFLSTLFHMTAGAMGLTYVSAACVALEENGLLVFGPPNSGKTTSGYLAGKFGLRFHADTATFLELEGDVLRAWGEFWPAAFRAETQLYLPEILACTRPFSFHDLNFLCMEKCTSEATKARSVIPALCVLLEREAATVPRLSRLTSGEFAERLGRTLLLKDYEQFELQRATVFRSLTKLPAYRLVYGSDPGEAAVFFRSLLTTHNLLGAHV